LSEGLGTIPKSNPKNDTPSTHMHDWFGTALKSGGV